MCGRVSRYVTIEKDFKEHVHCKVSAVETGVVSTEAIVVAKYITRTGCFRHVE